MKNHTTDEILKDVNKLESLLNEILEIAEGKRQMEAHEALGRIAELLRGDSASRDGLRPVRADNRVVADDEIDEAWGCARFGEVWDSRKRALVVQSVLKRMCGYHQGYTSKAIASDLGLIGQGGKVTKKGKAFVWQEIGSNL